MFGLFKCKACQKLEEENRYLRTLVDRLLEKTNITPVEPPPLHAQSKQEILEESFLPPGAQKFGD